MESDLGTSAIYSSKSGRKMWYGGSTLKTHRDGETQLYKSNTSCSRRLEEWHSWDVTSFANCGSHEWGAHVDCWL